MNLLTKVTAKKYIKYYAADVEVTSIGHTIPDWFCCIINNKSAICCEAQSSTVNVC